MEKEGNVWNRIYRIRGAIYPVNYIKLIWKLIAFRNLDVYDRNFLISWQNVRENLIPYTKDFEISLVALFISIYLQIFGTSSNLRNILYFSLKFLFKRRILTTFHARRVYSS